MGERLWKGTRLADGGRDKLFNVEKLNSSENITRSVSGQMFGLIHSVHPVYNEVVRTLVQQKYFQQLYI